MPKINIKLPNAQIFSEPQLADLVKKDLDLEFILKANNI